MSKKVFYIFIIIADAATDANAAVTGCDSCLTFAVVTYLISSRYCTTVQCNSSYSALLFVLYYKSQRSSTNNEGKLFFQYFR